MFFPIKIWLCVGKVKEEKSYIDANAIVPIFHRIEIKDSHRNLLLLEAYFDFIDASYKFLKDIFSV